MKYSQHLIICILDNEVNMTDKQHNKDMPGVGISGIYKFEHYDRCNNLIWYNVVNNAISAVGRGDMLTAFLQAIQVPTTFFLRLYNDTPADTDSLGSLTNEASGNGYAAQELTRDASGWNTLANEGGLTHSVTSKVATFSANGGSWGPVTNVVLATSSDNSGRFIGWAALGASRTLKDGEALKVNYGIFITST